MTTIDSALDNIMELDYASREILLEVLQKRQIEERREVIAADAKKSLRDYKEGLNVSLTAEQAIEKLSSL